MNEQKKDCSKSESLTLKDYYKKLPERTHPKTDFVNGLAEHCGMATATVRLWLYGKTKPRGRKLQESISEFTGIPVDKLF